MVLLPFIVWECLNRNLTVFISTIMDVGKSMSGSGLKQNSHVIIGDLMVSNCLT